MVLLTYQLPDAIREIAMQGEFNEFDLNVFFSAEGIGDKATVQVRGRSAEMAGPDPRRVPGPTSVDNLKLGAQKPPMPFSDARLLSVLSHTFWFLPSVASCYAMRNLLAKKQNRFYHDYTCDRGGGERRRHRRGGPAPSARGDGRSAHDQDHHALLRQADDGCDGQAMDGHSHASQLLQPGDVFSGGVPRAVAVDGPQSGRRIAERRSKIIKEECYVFDFAPDRALRQIADYSCRLNVNEANPEKKVEEFISFLPVLAYDGSSMKQIDAAGILDMAMSGTTATLLARRWESALLVNVDNDTLRRLMDNKKAMDALMSIEGFRNLNQEIETIINKSEAVKKARKEANDEELTAKERKELTEEEKEYKSLRKQIQEKLIKFATRVPIFMYLTDYRERSLEGCDHAAGTGLVQKGHRVDREGLRDCL